MRASLHLSRLAAFLLLVVPASAHAQIIDFTGVGFGGDERFNMGFAPILAMSNGQTSSMQIQTFNFYRSNVQVVQAGGRLAFVPQYQPIPVGLNLAVQAAVIGDGPFVRLSMAPTFQTSGIGPLYPVSTFVTPVFNGGAQGMPTPFTQYLYQPGFQQVGIQTTVTVPRGGGALLGGFRNGVQGRNQFGAPGFGNVGFFGGGANYPVFAPRIIIP